LIPMTLAILVMATTTATATITRAIFNTLGCRVIRDSDVAIC
jgi:hypothetical protein